MDIQSYIGSIWLYSKKQPIYNSIYILKPYLVHLLHVMDN